MPERRIFVTCDIGEALQQLADRGYWLQVHPQPEPPSHDRILEAVRSGIAALVTTIRDPIDSRIFEAGRGSLKVVSQYGVGYDNIDVKAASRCRIPVTNTPDVLTDATAEFALFMLGDLARKLYLSERLVREKRWTVWHPTLPFLGCEMAGKTVGVIGLGRIGKAFALKCSGLGVDILAHTRTPDRPFGESLQKLMDARQKLQSNRRRNRFRFVSLPECLQQSDFVSLHVPLNAETRHLIDSQALAGMKPEAFLINTSRGPVVDESALHQALEQGVIAGAALDVFETEPLPDDSPLRDPDLEDRLRLYHHLGSGTVETRLSPDPNIGMAGRCVQAALDVLEASDQARLSQMPLVINREVF